MSLKAVASFASSAGSRSLIGRKIGRYRVLDLLGKGGMASVWSARDELLGHTIALKTLSDALADSADARRRFSHEAQVATGLDHPAVAAVYEAGECDGIAYIAMALVDGETLRERVHRSLLPLGEAVRIISVAAAALGYAHARGVIHRDVTSRNVMLARDGRVLVLDFGLALAAGISRVSSSKTTVGTAGYMAPEVMLGQTADPRSDLYGLGIVFFEALTGTLPFLGEQVEVLGWAALNQEIRPPSALRPEVGPDLDRIVLKALARDPQDRYQNTDELLVDLKSLETERESRREASPHGAVTRGHSAVSELLTAGHTPLYLGIMGFEDRGPGPDEGQTRARLASALTETLASALASAHRVRVIVAPAGEASGFGVSPQEVARRLGANLLLRGTIRSSGSSVRISFTLLDPSGSEHVAGGTVHGTAQDMFALEDQLVSRVRTALGLAEPLETRPSLSHDPAAREHFEQALRYLQRTDNEASLDGAITLLTRLLTTEGEDAAVHASLARAYLLKHRRTGQHVWQGKAAASTERAAALNPESPEVLLALGDLHAATGRHEEALSEYRRALEGRSELFEAQLGLAWVLGAMQRSNEAEEACRRAVESRPQDWRGYHLLGELYFKLGQYARAIEPWRKSSQLTPDNALSASELGSAYFHLDRYEDAIAAYRRSIEIQPNARASTNLGTVLFYMRRYEDAADAFERAVLLTPSDPIFWGNLGNACWFIAGRKARAEEALRRAIDLMRERLSRSPADAEAWSRMAGWLVNLGAQEEARQAIERALAIDPSNVHCMVDAGLVYEQIGERRRALHWLGEAVRSGYGTGTLMRSPVLAALKGDPEFERILRSDVVAIKPRTKPAEGEEVADG